MANLIQPMEGRGVEADLLSGYPAELGRQDRRERKAQQDQERERRTWRLLQDLKGAGSEIAERLLAKAVHRMHTLALTDPELTLIFDALGEGVLAEIRQGERFARETALEICAQMLRLPGAPSPVVDHQPL